MSTRHLHRCAIREIELLEQDNRRQIVPIHTGKVQIGRAYIPPPHPMSHHAQQLQAALLEPRTARPLTLLQRMFGVIWRWL
jgi:hypothetical protein